VEGGEQGMRHGGAGGGALESGRPPPMGYGGSCCFDSMATGQDRHGADLFYQDIQPARSANLSVLMVEVALPRGLHGYRDIPVALPHEGVADGRVDAAGTVRHRHQVLQHRAAPGDVVVGGLRPDVHVAQQLFRLPSKVHHHLQGMAGTPGRRWCIPLQRRQHDWRPGSFLCDALLWSTHEDGVQAASALPREVVCTSGCCWSHHSMLARCAAHSAGATLLYRCSSHTFCIACTCSGPSAAVALQVATTHVGQCSTCLCVSFKARTEGVSPRRLHRLRVDCNCCSCGLGAFIQVVCQQQGKACTGAARVRWWLSTACSLHTCNTRVYQNRVCHLYWYSDTLQLGHLQDATRDEAQVNDEVACHAHLFSACGSHRESSATSPRKRRSCVNLTGVGNVSTHDHGLLCRAKCPRARCALSRGHRNATAGRSETAHLDCKCG
jgi:hypothetical protein